MGKDHIGVTFFFGDESENTKISWEREARRGAGRRPALFTSKKNVCVRGGTNELLPRDLNTDYESGRE